MVIVFTPKDPSKVTFKLTYGNRFPRLFFLNSEGDELEESIQLGGGLGAALKAVGDRIISQGGEYTHG